MAVSLEQFTKQLAESGVISEQDLRDYFEKLPSAENPNDGEQLAKRLVRDKKISAYQAQVVYSGKGKTLTMGSYTVLDKLGQGGMGMVLKAEHRMMKRLVAIKVLSPTVTKTKELAQRFQREVQAAARLTHPNIVGAFDAGETNGSPFLVMEYVPGDDLSSIVKKKGPLSVDQAIDCIAQAAKGLEFAHSQGVIHRDIKPANLLMDTKGVVKILDMGLARIEATDVATQADLTGTGAVMGTVDYMAPEQALSTKHADARSDLYSLGISLWYLLTGKSAYEGDSLMARLLAHREQPIPSLRAVRGDVPGSLDHVFEKLVAKKQADRYQTATELLVDLQACRTGASIKAVTVAEVATGPDEFQNFLQHIESPTEGPRGSRSNPSMAGTKTVARSQASVTSADETMSQAPVSETQRFRRPKSRRAKSPPWFHDKRVLIGGGAAAVLLLMAVVFLFQTPNGTLRVEIFDPEVEMRVKGSELTFHGTNLEPVSLKPGEKKLLVTRGDLSFETDSFTLKKGMETRVKVELLGDKLVVNGGGKVIAEQTIKRKGLTTSTTGGDSVASTSPRSNTSAPPPAIAPFDAKQARAHQDAWAKHLGVPVEYTNTIGMKFRLIPPGEFTMGLTPEQFEEFRKIVPDEHRDLMLRRAMPAHLVRITKPFYLQVEQVRLSQFTTLLGRKPPVDAELDTNDNLWRGVSWHDAIEFCNKLNEQEKRQVVYTVNGTETRLVSGAVGYRLPTEAEFEYASRAGTDTLLYFGNDSAAIRSHVRYYSGDNVLANPFGLIELYGGTLNWCWDAAPTLDSYPAEVLKQTNDPVGQEGAYRIRRGGLFFADGGKDVSQNNNFYRTSVPADTRMGLGRIVLTIPERQAANTTTTGKLFMHDPAFRQWVKDVQAMPAEQQVEAVRKKLVQLNPKFDGKLVMNHTGHGVPRVEDGKVTEFGFFTNEVADISPVAALRDLTNLFCGCNAYEMKRTPLTDVSPLQGLRLKSLDLFYNTSLSDLTPLKGMPLTSLILNEAKPIATLASLEGMMLTNLDIGGTSVKDLKLLKGMPLTFLNLFGTPVEDLTPLKGMPLKSLHMRDTPVADLSPLKGMELISLDIYNCRKISDVSPLHGMKLEYLVYGGTQVSDHSFLVGMPLKVVDLNFKLERDTVILRTIKTLEAINNRPAAEFWKEVEEPPKGKKP